MFRSKQAFQQTLKPLLDASVVQYRRLSGEYRVWQGTDFDIDERTDLEKEKLRQFELAAAISERVDSAPVVARRHSIETGALRYFELAFVDAQSRRLVGTNERPDPRIVFFLAETRDDAAAFHQARQTAGPNDIWVLHRNGAAIRASIGDVLALEGVQRGGQELASDPVASQEIKERLQTAQVAERGTLNALIGNPGLSDWYWRDEHLEVPDERAFQYVLSDIMDRIYDQSPVISNELINRERLSSQAAAARNKLFQHMLEDHDKAGFDIQKYPPERAIYRSVLEVGRLHVETDTGWKLVAPGENDPLNLRPAWSRLDELFALSESAPMSFEKFMEELAAPPRGLKRGLFPILFLHYYWLHRHELAIYDEGTYSPTLTYEHLERMVRRPDLFSFQRFRIEGVRSALFDGYSKALFGEVRESVTVLEIARHLTGFAQGLDEYSRKTQRLSEATLRVRKALLSPPPPEELVRGAIPQACGLDPDGDAIEFAKRVARSLDEMSNAHAVLLTDMRFAICGSFGIERHATLKRTRRLVTHRCLGFEFLNLPSAGVKGFVRRALDNDASDDAWLVGLLNGLVRKPTNVWSDQDRDIAEHRLLEVSADVLRLEKLSTSTIVSDQVSKTRPDVRSILLGTVCKDHGSREAVALYDDDVEDALKGPESEIRKIMAEVGNDELRLELVAVMAHDFLLDYCSEEATAGASPPNMR